MTYLYIVSDLVLNRFKLIFFI